MTVTPERDLRRLVDAELDRLAEMDLDALKARWLALKGVPLPKFMRRGWMTLAVADAIQEAAFGGLDPDSRKELAALAAQIVPTGQKPPPKPNKVKVGTRLIREWQGSVHEVAVVEGGFEWKGERYASLSVIARHITGTRWNGWLFFGLKKTKRQGTGSRSPAQQPGRSSAAAGAATARRKSGGSVGLPSASARGMVAIDG